MKTNHILLFLCLGGSIGMAPSSAFAKALENKIYVQKIIQPWGKETAENFRAFLAMYKHILLISVDKDTWESKKAPEHSQRHISGRVVKTYKGGWKSGEKIELFTSSDGDVPQQSPKPSDDLFFVFTNKLTKTKIGLDTGEILLFRPELEPALLQF